MENRDRGKASTTSDREDFPHRDRERFSILVKDNDREVCYNCGMGIMKDHIYSFEYTDMTEVLDTMKLFRFGFKTLGDLEVEEVSAHDGLKGCIPEESYAPPGLEAVEYRLAGGTSVVISPFLTKPELKVQIVAEDEDPDESNLIEKRIWEDISNIVHLNSRMGYCCE